MTSVPPRVRRPGLWIHRVSRAVPLAEATVVVAVSSCVWSLPPAHRDSLSFLLPADGARLPATPCSGAALARLPGPTAGLAPYLDSLRLAAGGRRAGYHRAARPWSQVQTRLRLSTTVDHREERFDQVRGVLGGGAGRREWFDVVYGLRFRPCTDVGLDQVRAQLE